MENEDIIKETENEKDEDLKEFIEVEMRNWKLLYFTNPNGIKLAPDDIVICDVDRGQDIGRVLNTCVRLKEAPDQTESGKPMSIIRSASQSDLSALEEINEREKLATAKFLETLPKYDFEMKLIETIYQFDGNKVTFFYTAEGRVDFRAFVRELALIFKKRIELHQSTGRDEAKKLGGFGMCGNEYCCSSFLKRFNQVTIKMAKDQNLSGNLSKISGPCGRLLCCLHFEEDFYAELAKDFPEMGDEIFIDGKKMYVFRNDLYSKKVYLTSDSQEMKELTLEEYNKKNKKRDRKENSECDNCECPNKVKVKNNYKKDDKTPT